MKTTPSTTVASTCPYCGVGCGVLIESDGHRVHSVRGDPQHPANFGRLCTKGSTLDLVVRDRVPRLLHPTLRRTRHGPPEAIRWDTALSLAAARFARIIQDHGPDAVGFYVSGQLLTEDYYAFNKLARGLVGTNNIDTNSRLCMSSAVTGYKQTLGADAPPCNYEDLGLADCLFIAGSNTAYAHPILYRRIEDARRANPDLKIIVVDPRRTDTAREADLHLAIQPGTDVALFNAMLNVMLWKGWFDPTWIDAHTSGFEELRSLVREYPPERVSRLCGVAEADIVTAARWFSGADATLSLYCQGLNQSTHGTDNNTALINLHLATAQIGRPGAGPFSLTGQPNAMGGREVGGMATLLGGHRDPTNPDHRAEIARFWGVDSLPDRPGKTALEMFEAAAQGEIRALWIACTNPAQSLPDQSLVRAALERAEWVVVQEVSGATETAAYADLLLPAAGWGEKEGTVTNSERRISRVRRAIAPPGVAWPDWQIAVRFARSLGEALGRPTDALFPYETPEQLFDEHRETTRGRDLDITGLSYDRLETLGPQCWPFPEGATAGRARLYQDARFATPDGRARFVAAHHRPSADRIDAAYPLWLNTGRLRDQWHGMSRTGTVARLYNHVESPLLSMHPEDMARRQLRSGDLVRLHNRRGAIMIAVESSEEQAVGQVFVPMHWGSRHMAGLGINGLTSPARDPYSKQPELKLTAVAVEKVVLPWKAVAMRQATPDRMVRVQALLERFDYASCGLYGRNDPVLVLRAAHLEPPDTETLGALDQAFDLDGVDAVMSYEDPHRRISKRVLVVGERIVGACLMGETAAADWIKQMMAEGAELGAVRNWILAPVDKPPDGSRGRGRVVCNCFDVAEKEINEALDEGLDFAALQGKLRCGTQCGSCIPELHRRVKLRAGKGQRAA